MKRFLIIASILFCAACTPVLATGDEHYPLAPANEVWLNGYMRGIHDACVNASVAIQKELAGAVSDQARYSIVEKCGEMADDVHTRARKKMYFQENFSPTPTPRPLPPSSTS